MTAETCGSVVENESVEIRDLCRVWKGNPLIQTAGERTKHHCKRNAGNGFAGPFRMADCRMLRLISVHAYLGEDRLE
jgi:hypothetical protein